MVHFNSILVLTNSNLVRIHVQISTQVFGPPAYAIDDSMHRQRALSLQNNANTHDYLKQVLIVTKALKDLHHVIKMNFLELFTLLCLFYVSLFILSSFSFFFFFYF